MNRPRWQRERRAEARRPEPARRISWTRETPTRLCTAWLSDRGTSGIAFVTPARDQPLPSETIELNIGTGHDPPEHQHVRVVRTAPYDQYFSLVGCRREQR